MITQGKWEIGFNDGSGEDIVLIRNGDDAKYIAKVQRLIYY